MTTVSAEHRARQALAFLAQTLRPDWDPPGVTKAIEELHRDRQPLGLIARATIAAALTPTTKTPGGIAARIRDGFDGAETPTVTPTAPHINTLRCSKCGAIKPEGDERHSKHCGRIADPHEGAAKARAEIRQTVRNEREETP